ncbi:MAG: cobalamin biosynthesis protein CbiA [Pseudomonadota bacterium]
MDNSTDDTIRAGFPIRLEGMVVIVGNYGSGKTEVAVNLAVNRKKAGMDVTIADLDLVNPYFRAREARRALSELGIRVVIPPEQYLQADLPILTPAIAGLIRNPAQISILDVGGDSAGATVLAALSDAFRALSATTKPFHMLQVINPFRPFTETIEGCLKIRAGIENASRLSITGVIGNANLIEETRVEDIERGYEFVAMLSEKTNLPVKFIAISRELACQIDLHRFSCPVLMIERQMVPPWNRAARFE